MLIAEPDGLQTSRGEGETWQELMEDTRLTGEDEATAMAAGETKKQSIQCY